MKGWNEKGKEWMKLGVNIWRLKVRMNEYKYECKWEWTKIGMNEIGNEPILEWMKLGMKLGMN